MNATAVIFDLFGTLVKHFSVAEYDRVLQQMAHTLAIPYAVFREQSGQVYRAREVGHFATLEASLAHLCRDRLHLAVTPEHITQVAQYPYEYIAQLLVPEAGTVETLRTLQARGFTLGVVSNCGPEVAHLWPYSPLGSLIEVAVFSCDVGVCKPDPRIYAAVCEQLDIEPAACVYVGDGSSGELQGAAHIGMYPVLKRISLEDVYDRDRPEVETWRGPEIQAISEIIDLLESRRQSV